ncbi:hypothetical protein Taro_029621 [Colocasia esculenta]|uniref:J domain-containing protein n=1 Tax=Colocasia esculenta TaxID=4460 RepID=A0A843VJD5_COLES|nr:hypothetical protein [Colocasia esculenta]
MAAPPLSSSSSAASDLMRDRAFRRSFSLPSARFSATCAASPAGGHCHYYAYPRSSDGAAAVGTLYDVLGLAAGATAREIKQAYRRLARACHPDAAGGGREGASADEFMRVHAAYATLSDPNKRAEYDRRMVTSAAARRPPPFHYRPSSSSASYYSPPAAPSSSSPSPRFPGRTWETDQCW